MKLPEFKEQLFELIAEFEKDNSLVIFDLRIQPKNMDNMNKVFSRDIHLEVK